MVNTQLMSRALSTAVIMLLCVLVHAPVPAHAQLAAGRKFVGNVVNNGNNIRSDFNTYWNQVTAENAGKWGSVEGSPGSYNWTELDKIYNYALNHAFPYKHHNLIWGNQQPGFMDGLDSASQYQEIVNWFSASGARYPSASFCDVVNEPLHAVPSYKNALGGNGATGWDWVIKAFQLARQYWPHVKLLINEYSVINDGNANTQYLQIISLLKARNLVDGIGVQAHYFEVDGGASLSTLKTNLDKLTATGLPVYISEFDINQASDSVQSARYQSLFPLLYENPGVAGVTLWGYAQNETWRPNTWLVGLNGERPALKWLRKYLAIPPLPVLVAPVGQTGVQRNAVLVWRRALSAQSYRVQAATDTVFSSIVADSTISDTTLGLSPLAANTKYYWHVSASNDSGTSSYSITASFTTGDQVLDVREGDRIPAVFALSQNHPNPFNPSTNFEIRISKSEFVSLGVYDMLGRQVAVLVNEQKTPGEYTVRWNAEGMASGVYILRMQAGSFTAMKKLVLLR